MNRFINHFDDLIDVCSEEYTESVESDFIEHILEHSPYTDIEQFAAQHIPADIVEQLFFSSDDAPVIITEYIENNPQQFNFTVDPTLDSHQLAYSLAYDNPEYATKLLDELLYYRSKGRI